MRLAGGPPGGRYRQGRLLKVSVAALLVQILEVAPVRFSNVSLPVKPSPMCIRTCTTVLPLSCHTRCGIQISVFSTGLALLLHSKTLAILPVLASEAISGD
ncbi:hypothetical protein C6W88_04605 [Halomonas litopenaei]|uniref:Uncharacterized protein n=1 Tax=Halomonas litopenaei TaxID=2109328 RepID=A0ABX5IZ02_9GAMM|nr:hypothetical protein C6W89_00560 [Halomonas sp. SYSU XM8]PTL95735.1 hypothetical protein C6W88_04605 [Halomonas litopenaei]